MSAPSIGDCYRVLSVLWESGQLTAAEIAKRAGMSDDEASAALDACGLAFYASIGGEYPEGDTWDLDPLGRAFVDGYRAGLGVVPKTATLVPRPRYCAYVVEAHRHKAGVRLTQRGSNGSWLSILVRTGDAGLAQRERDVGRRVLLGCEGRLREAE